VERVLLQSLERRLLQSLERRLLQSLERRLLQSLELRAAAAQRTGCGILFRQHLAKTRRNHKGNCNIQHRIRAKTTQDASAV
jgi:hypothetical protein